MNDSTHHSELLAFSSRNGNGLFVNPRVASASGQRIRRPQAAAGSHRQQLA
ncbi:hypothetical protein [Pseudoscardovia suis]